MIPVVIEGLVPRGRKRKFNYRSVFYHEFWRCNYNGSEGNRLYQASDTCRQGKFTKEFNERTKGDIGLIIPVVITVYSDRTFTFITKTPPAAVLIKKACGIETASGEPNKKKVAKITREQVQKIAEQKMPDLNAASIEAACSMIAGTARSMGIEVVD